MSDLEDDLVDDDAENLFDPNVYNDMEDMRDQFYGGDVRRTTSSNTTNSNQSSHPTPIRQGSGGSRSGSQQFGKGRDKRRFSLSSHKSLSQGSSIDAAPIYPPHFSSSPNESQPSFRNGGGGGGGGGGGETSSADLEGGRKKSQRFNVLKQLSSKRIMNPFFVRGDAPNYPPNMTSNDGLPQVDPAIRQTIRISNSNEHNMINPTERYNNTSPPNNNNNNQFSIPSDAPVFVKYGGTYIQIPSNALAQQLTNRRRRFCSCPVMTRTQKIICFSTTLFLVTGIVGLIFGFFILNPILNIRIVPPAPAPTKTIRTFSPTSGRAPVSLSGTTNPTVPFDARLAKIRQELIEGFSNNEFTQNGPPYPDQEFQNGNSPQYKALEWLSLRDRFYIPVGKGGVELAHRYLMAVLYFSLDGPNWIRKKNWLENVHECEWEGVTCDDENLRVVGLELQRNQLAGEFPFEMTYFVYLQRLSLFRNELFGTIPTVLGRMTDLEYLDLHLNPALIGNIPLELTLLPQLKEVHLSNCSLSSTLPSEFSSLPSLEVLNLNSNKLNGFLPKELGNMMKLQKLMLGDNQFFGTIPAPFGNLKNLNTLELWSNSLSGNIPQSFAGLENLNFLFLDDNKLVGKIPDVLGNLPLQDLTIARNRFSGPIPTTFGNFQQLRRLWLSQNLLTGTIPVELFSLSGTLHFLYLDFNRLSGSISAQLSNLENIEDIRINNNQFTGCLPRTLFELSRLRVFYGDENAFDCSPPDFFLNSPSIVDLQLQNNKFHGNLPKLSLIESPLEVLDLSFNKFNGIIPTSYKRLENIVNLNLSNNDLNGPIPVEISFLGNLEKCNLSENDLTGDLDLFLNNKKLIQLELQGNQLNGDIPNELGSIANLEMLKLEDNNIVGNVPFSVCRLNLDVFTTDCLSEVNCQCCTGCN